MSTDSARIHTWGCDEHKEDTYEGCYTCDLHYTWRLEARIAELVGALRDLVEANDDYLNGDTGFPFADALAKAKAFMAGPAPPVIHDRPLSASQRLHNICDALSEHANESPFTREEWDAIDKQTVRLQSRVKELEAEVSTLREHLAEVNRLMSLNCRELERLRGSSSPLGEGR